MGSGFWFVDAQLRGARMSGDEWTYDQVAEIYADAVVAADYSLDYPWQTGLLAVYRAGYEAALAGRAIV